MQGAEFILNKRIAQACEVSRNIQLSGNLGKAGLLEEKTET